MIKKDINMYIDLAFTKNTNTYIEINALLFPTLYSTRQVFLIILRKSRTLCNFVSLILLKR